MIKLTSKEFKIHPEIEHLENEVLDHDRSFFLNHPFAQHYYRKPFEFEQLSIKACGCDQPIRKVLVQRVDENTRSRTFLF